MAEIISNISSILYPILAILALFGLLLYFIKAHKCMKTGKFLTKEEFILFESFVLKLEISIFIMAWLLFIANVIV